MDMHQEWIHQWSTNILEPVGTLEWVHQDITITGHLFVKETQESQVNEHIHRTCS